MPSCKSTIIGESVFGDINASDDFKNKFLGFVKEENFFYRMLPRTTLASKREEVAKEYKNQKD